MIVETLVNYTVRVGPGIAIALLFLALLPRTQPEFRIFPYIVAFILIRDGITPLGLWWFGEGTVFWMRMNTDPGLVLFVGSVCFGVALLMNAVEPELRRLVVWFRGARSTAIAGGLAGAAIIWLPFMALYSSIPIAARGGPVDSAAWLPFVSMCLLINFYEELLFRGYLQGYLERHVSPLRAAMTSGIAFCFGHLFLAITVTDTPALIYFTLYEGLVASLVRMRFGTIPSILTHGLGIVPLVAGLF